MWCVKRRVEVVSNVPKILKWEQITTHIMSVFPINRCFQCSKDTKMGANHNGLLAYQKIYSLFPMFQRY